MRRHFVHHIEHSRESSLTSKPLLIALLLNGHLLQLHKRNTELPDKHINYFLVPCKKWVVHCPVYDCVHVYTSQIIFHKVSDKWGHVKLVTLYTFWQHRFAKANKILLIMSRQSNHQRCIKIPATWFLPLASKGIRNFIHACK